MKFSLIALVATATAIKITKGDDAPCPTISQKQSNRWFEEADTSKDGKLSMKEVEAILKSFHADASTIKAVLKMAKKDAGKDGVLDKKEFNKLANAVN